MYQIIPVTALICHLKHPRNYLREVIWDIKPLSHSEQRNLASWLVQLALCPWARGILRSEGEEHLKNQNTHIFKSKVLMK
jgi:hypothetical protein